MWNIIGYIAFGLFTILFVANLIDIFMCRFVYKIGKLSQMKGRTREQALFVRRKERMSDKMFQYLALVWVCVAFLWLINLFGVESESYGWKLTGYAVIGYLAMIIVILFWCQCAAGWQWEEPEEQRKKREARAYKRRRFWQSIFGGFFEPSNDGTDMFGNPM